MEWTTEKRYTPYSKWSAETLLDLQKSAAKSNYQLHYHIHPTSGLLNDPNGFSYFNNQWHVFYQSYPFGAVHGLKSWVHMVSDDLVNWKNLGTTVKPDTPLDSHGAYSGSAKEIDGKLFLMYTGNVRDKDWNRISYQIGAFLDKNENLTKLDKPLIEAPDHVTEHFRDPQILEHDGQYYAILGAQDKKTKGGAISIYTANRLEGPWRDLGYVKFTNKQMGYMIECPNLIFIDKRPVLIFCPQGLDKKITNYENVYPNMYWVGDQFRYNSGKFTSRQETPVNLDDGFDVYATQAFNAPDGKAYAISWVGLPDVTYPTDSEGWANCLSQVKELSLDGDKLIQRPVTSITALRHDGQHLKTEASFNGRQEIVNLSSNQYELKLTIDAKQQGNLHLAGSKFLEQSLKLNFNTGKEAFLTIDRSNSGEPVNEDYGTTRSIELTDDTALELDIFVDHSLCEVFVNNGEHVMTLRFFPQKENTQIAMTGESEINYTGTIWKMSDI